MFVYIRIYAGIYICLCPMAETPRHGDIVADTENVLQTVLFTLMKTVVVYINVLKVVCNYGHFPPAALHAGMKVFYL